MTYYRTYDEWKLATPWDEDDEEPQTTPCPLCGDDLPATWDADSERYVPDEACTCDDDEPDEVLPWRLWQVSRWDGVTLEDVGSVIERHLCGAAREAARRFPSLTLESIVVLPTGNDRYALALRANAPGGIVRTAGTSQEPSGPRGPAGDQPGGCERGRF